MSKNQKNTHSLFEEILGELGRWIDGELGTHTKDKDKERK